MLNLKICNRFCLTVLAYIWYDSSAAEYADDAALVKTFRDMDLLQGNIITDKGMSWIKSRVDETIGELANNWHMTDEEYYGVLYKCLNLLDTAELPRFLVHTATEVREAAAKVIDSRSIK